MAIEKTIHHREKTDKIVKEYQEFKTAFAKLDESLNDMMEDHTLLLDKVTKLEKELEDKRS